MKKYKVTTSYWIGAGDISQDDDWIFDTKEEAQEFVDKFHAAFPKNSKREDDPFIYSSSSTPEIKEIEVKDPYEWLEQQIQIKQKETKEHSGKQISKLEALGITVEGDIATIPSTYNTKIPVLYQGEQMEKIGIPTGAFRNMNLKEIHMENSPVEAFGYDCFAGNDNVTIYAKKQKYHAYPQNIYFLQTHIKYVN